MENSRHRVWIALTEVTGGIICDACKFSVCYGGETPCDCGEPFCEHPLATDTPEPGVDCQFFKPCHRIGFFADVVGVVLSNGWEYDGYVVFKDKKKQWRVAQLRS
jgi:hypothetical protein